MVATYCHLPQYTHVTLYSRRYYVPINDNMCNEANFGNIALGKEATLTSTFDEYSKANQAVDGVWPEADINHRCAQTSLDWAPQLFIDLKQEHYVDHIVLLSRGDVEASHDFALSKINIWVDSSYCGYYEGPAEPGTNATIVCDKCLTGKVVAVSAWDGIRSRYLSVCEVMIIGLKK
ncbi:uncharacterized protein LOC133188262 [Saccostrea echinata]|uniref:uncharacterized protein LOC133188262 n=1 Tax=Saccostrea echinata TaxID=191078 RepID=UPI002A81F802|nr:uncharacterized protein LOC133188262 [Saccostrea echinata]